MEMFRQNPNKTPLSLLEQSIAVTSKYKTFHQTSRGKRFNWCGTIQPAPKSCIYKVKIRYQLGSRPEVTVTDPLLTGRKDEPQIPHTFTGKRLCLHMPNGWSSRDSIAESIIPWISLWLYHYEVWQATGEWLGGGHEVSQQEKSNI